MTEELKPSATPIQATLVPVKVWIEKDMMGTVHIKRQHEGGPAFDFIQIQYSHMHTCNAHQHGLAEQIVAILSGAALTAAQPGQTGKPDLSGPDAFDVLSGGDQARASLPTPPAAQAAQVPKWRQEIDAALSLFPLEITGQSFSVANVNNGDHLKADGDTVFFSSIKVKAFLEKLRGHLTAAQQGAAHG